MAVEPIRRVRRERQQSAIPSAHDRLDNHEERIEALEGVAEAIAKVSEQIKRYGLLILGALAASGVVTGPWGKFIAEVVARSAHP